jgi:hypothetical protein
MNFGFQYIDHDEEQRHQFTEAQYPFVSAFNITYQAYHRQKERVPKAGLAHRPQRRALQAHPHADDEKEEYQRA